MNKQYLSSTRTQEPVLLSREAMSPPTTRRGYRPALVQARNKAAAKRVKLSAHHMADYKSLDQCGSDTEEDSDAEEVAQLYLAKTPPPKKNSPYLQQIYDSDKDQPLFSHRFHADTNANDDIELQINPTLSALAKKMGKQDSSNKEDPVPPSSSNPFDAKNKLNPKYPSSPKLSSSTFKVDLPRRSAPTQNPPPAQTIPTYRTRYPSDTQFHHGSAGIDPLGAYSRPVAGQRLQHGSAATTRHHQIVSGSFGSFEPGRPLRFDEREYQLLAGGKRKRGELDIFKGKPWLRRE